MRIVGGRMRGTRLAGIGAGDPGAHLRPTTDRVRENIFNLLVNGGHGNRVAGARVLDLFAGTGALGLEALSRGAAHVSFVENGRTAQALILANVAKCRAEAETALLRTDATRLGPCTAPFDLILIDAPYGTDLGARALASALAGGWLCDTALVMSEDEAPPAVPAGLVQRDQRRYGGTVITILEKGA